MTSEIWSLCEILLCKTILDGHHYLHSSTSPSYTSWDKADIQDYQSPIDPWVQTEKVSVMHVF